MADGEEGENSSTRGTGWEVVSLTASAYAASPGPRAFDPTVESKKEIDDVELVASPALFMSDHFLGSRSQHIDLFVEGDHNEIHNIPHSLGVNPSEQEQIEAIRSYEKEQIGEVKSDKDNCRLESDDNMHKTQFIDQEEHVSNLDMEFGQGKGWDGLTAVGEQKDIYENPSFSPLHAKIDTSQSVLSNETVIIADPDGPSLEYSSQNANTSESAEDSKHDGYALPCEAWWKKQAISIYTHAKESSKLWHLFMAAAVVGFAFLGQQWQKEKLHLQQLKWLSINDETMNQMLAPFSRFKDILIGGQQRNLFIRGGTAPSNH